MANKPIEAGVLREFVSAVREASSGKPSQKEYLSGVVTHTDVDGTVWVDVAGGVNDMPVTRSTASYSPGDVVSFSIENGVASIGGNTSDPAAPMSKQVTVEKKVLLTEELVEKVGTVVATKADIQDLNAANAQIEQLQAADVTITGKLTAAEGDISQLQADTADIDTIRANSAKVQNLTAEELSAATGYISDLTAENISASNLAADHATVGSLSTNYARIDGANITNLTATNGWLDKIMVQTGMLSHTGTIYELDAIQVNASSIKAGTLDVERLIVTQTDAQGNQQKYLVHVDAQGAATYQKMDGNIIQDLTITTDKLVAGAVTADKITTQNIEGTGGWINLRNGTFAYLNATTGEGIAWDGQHLTIAGSVTVGSSQLLLEQIAQMAQDADANVQFKVTETYNNAKTQATVTAHVYKGGVDIATEYPTTAFSWFIKNEDTVVPVPLNPPNGYSITVDVSEAGYGAAIVCRFTPPNDSTLLDSDDDTLTDSNGTPVSGRTPSGDYVRIVDLEATTTVFDTDRLLLVGSEEEQLVSIATLKDVFGDGDYERLDNKPSIEGVTLSGDKTFQELGIFQTDGQGYDVPDDYTLSTLDINALWANAQPIGA